MSFAQFSDQAKDIPLWREGPGCYWFFEGFKILSPEGLSRSAHDRYDRERVGPMELQPVGVPDDEHHRMIAAYVEDDLAGAVMMRWVKGYSPMWHYCLSFVETRVPYRNQGIGRMLLRILDSSPSLDSKILQLTHFEPLGSKYLPNAISQELRAKTYTLLPADFHWNAGTPASVGRYDVHGNRIPDGDFFDNDGHLFDD
jgi:GNAT superfamily N-acetyltransferase